MGVHGGRWCELQPAEWYLHCRRPCRSYPDNARLLTSLRNLKHFLESFDFVSMHPDRGFVVSGIGQKNPLSRTEPARRPIRSVHPLRRRGRRRILPGKSRTLSRNSGSRFYQLTQMQDRSTANCKYLVIATNTFESTGATSNVRTPDVCSSPRFPVALQEKILGIHYTVERSSQEDVSTFKAWRIFKSLLAPQVRRFFTTHNGSDRKTFSHRL